MRIVQARRNGVAYQHLRSHLDFKLVSFSKFVFLWLIILRFLEYLPKNDQTYYDLDYTVLFLLS